MTSYDDCPWLAQYAPVVVPDTAPEFTDALSMFRAAVEGAADATVVSSFDRRLTLREQFGVSIRSMCRLTETTSASHAVPWGAGVHLDPASALSAGVPFPDAMARIVNEDGRGTRRVPR